MYSSTMLSLSLPLERDFGHSPDVMFFRDDEETKCICARVLLFLVNIGLLLLLLSGKGYLDCFGFIGTFCLFGDYRGDILDH